MRITVTNDQLQYPKDKTFTVQLKTGVIAHHTFWENARLDDVTVSILIIQHRSKLDLNVIDCL